MKQKVKMTPLERAKQFAPFAALRGYEDELEQAQEVWEIGFRFGDRAQDSDPIDAWVN